MMTTSYISSLSLWNAPRGSVGRLSTELAQANREIVDQRFADVGLALGARVGLSFGLRQKAAELGTLQDGNRIASLRLSASQTVLKQMQAAADATLQDLIALPSADRASALAAAAGSQLTALVAGLNASAAGQYVFAGTNTGTAPIKDGALATAKGAIDAAFSAAFTFPQGDPRAAGITGAAMERFLDALSANLSRDDAWTEGWSNAASRNIDSQISLSETIETSANANAPAIRTLATAYAIAANLDLTALGRDAAAAVTARVTSLLGGASGGLVALQADLGRAQARITDANTRLDTQASLLKTQVQDLEYVDPAEAKSRVDALETQIQMSYALTAQLRQLSLVAYLS